MKQTMFNINWVMWPSWLEIVSGLMISFHRMRKDGATFGIDGKCFGRKDSEGQKFNWLVVREWNLIEMGMVVSWII